MKKILCALFLTFVFAEQALAAQLIGVQNINVGMSGAEAINKAKEVVRDFSCRNNSCKGYITIKNKSMNIELLLSGNPAKADSIYLGSIDINFTNSNYELIRDALIEKYGLPGLSKTELLQNNMGATRERIISIWALEDGDIVLYSYYPIPASLRGAYEYGRVDMMSKRRLAEIKAEMSKEKAAPGF